MATRASGYPTSDFRPNQELMEELMGMGFDQETSTQALFYSGNNNSDAAVSWIFDNQGQSPHMGGAFDAALLEEWGPASSGEESKMVIVVNSSLSMSAGKIGAQCAHAAVGAYRLCAESGNGPHRQMLQKWTNEGEVTIVLNGDNAPHLEALERRAKDKGLVALLISDAGRTEVAHGAKTALCIFGDKRQVDTVTASLKTL